MKQLIDKLYNENSLSKEELLILLNDITEEEEKYLAEKSLEIKSKYYGDTVFMRGLIEFTNYCQKNCMYCGIRAANINADRYRLTLDEIMECCIEGDRLGYKTFVLQGGEDPYFDDDKIIEIIKTIKSRFKDTAITLSIGEKSYDSYKKFYEAGADRYLLRHETASKELYEKLHPNMSFENRMRCLKDLKEIGYQVGAGFMVGLPGQSNEDFVEDLIFLKELKPHMIGIGPFISQKDTPLNNEENGTLEKTLVLLSIIRLMLPNVLLPSTTALGSLDTKGREKALKVGANVVMPNLSPTSVREKYALYDGKICTGDEAAHCRNCIEGRIKGAGFSVDMSRGDNINWRRK
ncbi:[FeFe] hydrogenase H-cluster radical SAM maturase HydE [Clostridium grantii]|uniref:[FeFe] hydrogenase H-cluster radical SAM maturase HydE n=1 Tax=Clostridium grantii TaxID=40575 RepID=UPI0009344C29|nr:[FeFe] hydrogenase H-cluster radical SAM maturase HydE [Clostridium grantii]